MSLCAWDQRIRRASELSSVYPFAAEALHFYERMAPLQGSLYRDFEQEFANSADLAVLSSPHSLREELDIAALVPRFSWFLAAIEPIAPMPLARAAGTLARRGSAVRGRVMSDFWQREARLSSAVVSSEHESNASETMLNESLAWLFLQPYAEHIRDRHGPVHVEGTPSNCPLCAAKPIVGVLRPEGDGAKKSLICMLCAHEWTFRRLYCPSCGEEREPRMAFYSAPEIPHVRVDVCDTCHTYLKSVDLTKTGLAVPIIDELATLPLDLWARENGYTKLQINILGI